MHVCRIDAEVEDVVLGQPHVLEQLPRRVLEPRCPRAALVGSNAVDGLVESDVRLFPVEHADEVIANRVVWHEADYLALNLLSNDTH